MVFFNHKVCFDRYRLLGDVSLGRLLYLRRRIRHGISWDRRCRCRFRRCSHNDWLCLTFQSSYRTYWRRSYVRGRNIRSVSLIGVKRPSIGPNLLWRRRLHTNLNGFRADILRLHGNI